MDVCGWVDGRMGEWVGLKARQMELVFIFVFLVRERRHL